MKSITKLALLSAIVLGAVLFPQGVNGAPARDGGATFNDAEGKEWLLLELKSGGKTITMYRQKLALDNLIGVYSLSFKEGRLSGMGAPNRYNAPYSVDVNRSLNIGLIASTMMAAFREPPGLKEKEFFDSLSATQRWDLFQGRLELYSKDNRGNEAVLVFVLK